MYDREYFDAWSEYIKPEIFSASQDRIEIAILHTIRTYPDPGNVPKDVLICGLGESNLNDEEYKHAKEFISEIPSSIQEVDRGWLNDQTQEFYRDKAFYANMWKGIDAHISAEERREYLQGAIDATSFTFDSGLDIININDAIQSFVPPEYLIEEVFVKGYAYAMTGETGSGKTAVALCIAKHVATGESIGNREVEKGRVLYFAGENPPDVIARCVAMFDISKQNDIWIYPFAGRDAVNQVIPKIIRKGEPIALVIVDTSTSYFGGDDDNNNRQALDHAKWLRSLSDKLPGNPTVLVCCHPKLGATADTMYARGGSSFTNELDGNLACLKAGDWTTIENCRKLRGPDIPKIAFRRELKYIPGKKRDMPTIIARYSPPEEFAQSAVEIKTDDKLVLKLLEKDHTMTLKTMAGKLLWFKEKGKHKGDPDIDRANRAITRLRKDGLIDQDNQLTEAGRAQLEA